MATSKTLFISETCIHCQRLQTALQKSGTQIDTIDISKSPENLALYIDQATAVGYQNGGVPLLIDGQTYIEGTDPILTHLGLLTSAQTQTTTLTKEDAAMIQEIAGEEQSQPLWLIPLILIFFLVLWKIFRTSKK